MKMQVKEYARKRCKKAAAGLKFYSKSPVESHRKDVAVGDSTAQDFNIFDCERGSTKQYLDAHRRKAYISQEEKRIHQSRRFCLRLRAAARAVLANRKRQGEHHY